MGDCRDFFFSERLCATLLDGGIGVYANSSLCSGMNRVIEGLSRLMECAAILI